MGASVGGGRRARADVQRERNAREAFFAALFPVRRPGKNQNLRTQAKARFDLPQAWEGPWDPQNPRALPSLGKVKPGFGLGT